MVKYCLFCCYLVRLEPNVTYGAIEIWTEDKYQLVCADDFDDVAAKVVCKAAGFQNGISICCSAFGDMSYSIGYYGIGCQGDEASILDCEYKAGIGQCRSNKYASVACSDQPASGGLWNF